MTCNSTKCSVKNEESVSSAMRCDFTISTITDNLFLRINGNSYNTECTVPLKELRYLSILHHGFDGTVHIGELIVHEAIAEDVLYIFMELYNACYPIEKVMLIDEYDADDDASMADNNSSAFNFRFIDDGTKQYSYHAKGMAVDINPLYNPYIRIKNGCEMLSPPEAAVYADRTKPCRYYIHKDDICYRIFSRYGFTWGGDWIDRKDYQHFEKQTQLNAKAS